MGAGLIFIKPLAAFLGSTKGAYSSALEYGRIVFISTPVVILVYVLESIIRAEGKTLLVFWAILGGGIVNIILDFVLIFGRHMGVKGCALASALGQTLAVIIMLIPYISGKTILSPKRLSIRKALFSFPVIVKTGLPSFLRQGLVCVAGILLNRSCSRYGDGALAGISAANRIFTIFFSAAVGYGQALAPVIGYNYGAKKNERVRKSYIFAQITGAAFMVFCGAALYFFSDFVAGWFFPQGATKSAAVMALKADCFSFPFIACFVMAGVLYQSVGRVGSASLIYSLRQGVFFIPLIYILPYFLGFRGIIWASPGADMLAGVVSVILTLRIYFDIL
jgi:putative MATE family efflux protein